MFEAVIVEQARGRYDTLLGEDLAQINDIIRRLEQDPWGDEESKFAVVLVGEVMVSMTTAGGRSPTASWTIGSWRL